MDILRIEETKMVSFNYITNNTLTAITYSYFPNEIQPKNERGCSL